MFAIVQISGHQYKVSPKDVVVVDRLEENVGDTVKFSKVLLVSDEKVHVGAPFLDNVVVSAKITKHFKGKKIRVARFRAKSRYRKVTGFRPLQTELLIEKIISAKDKKENAKTSKKE